MRHIGCIAVLVSLLFATSSMNGAAWKEYPQPQLGFVVEFPAEPVSAMGLYKTTLVPSANAHIYSVKEDHAVYVATVVDLLDRKEEGATLLGEAESILTLLGNVTSTSISRVEPGRAAIFGRFITMECQSGRASDVLGQTSDTARAWFKNMTGVECPDRS